MYQVTKAVYRFAEHDDEIPPGHVVTILDTPGIATVVVRPGHARQRLLDALAREQTAILETGEWMRQSPGDTDEPAPTVHSARWELVPAHKLPDGRLCLPVERNGEHVWLIRDGEASPELVAEMTERLTALVRAGVWARFGSEGCGV
ncbi:hypothetical protein [Streptomyces sp. CC228A]|uniref:hypothetical protein n=1 Tax=Streptomyces sp. CC228A TaxID=2898186 RepID=UPI001F1C8378|nr:hypothetical protein [Streptomyces sp. CC228A]